MQAVNAMKRSRSQHATEQASSGRRRPRRPGFPNLRVRFGSGLGSILWAPNGTMRIYITAEIQSHIIASNTFPEQNSVFLPETPAFYLRCLFIKDEGH